MGKPADIERYHLVANIQRDVEAIAKRRDRHALHDVMESTGFMSNTQHTLVELRDAIIALAPGLSLFWLRNTASGAAFARAASEGKDHDTSQRAADRARLLPRLQAVTS